MTTTSTTTPTTTPTTSPSSGPASAPTSVAGPAADGKLRLDLWTDLGCPWCYLGKDRLEKAVQQTGLTGRVELHLHSYELDPNASTTPITIPEIFTTKHGGTREQALASEARIRQLAHAEGLPFTTDRLHANTSDVHRVLQLANAHAAGEAFFTPLQRGFFAGEVDPYDHEVLTDFAVRAGVPAAEVRDVLAGDRCADDVRADIAQARRLGITGVPFLVLGQRLAVAGAQGVDAYAHALTTAAPALPELERLAEDATSCSLDGECS